MVDETISANAIEKECTNDSAVLLDITPEWRASLEECTLRFLQMSHLIE